MRRTYFCFCRGLYELRDRFRAVGRGAERDDDLISRERFAIE